MTPELITRIAAGQTTPADAEAVAALYEAAQNVRVEVTDELDAFIISPASLESLLTSLAGVEAA